ncbi:hypothetical protein B0T16DRAFT_459166 [Cercophora newfieldiana]|uniref:Uncharacterized protein n=1 Tax=Cercophora newfieldiana TaxID=92897 RepID=A0AA39Y153_9PEZI|nr:hypothetical protein B0T16DRAFT_459166 [Cercophora newfieldiana]
MKWSTIFSLAWASTVLATPLQPRDAALCEDIEYIIGDYGSLKGSLQGANILIPGLSRTDAGAVVRQFLAFLDPANLNVYALYESIASCTTAGATDVKPPSAATCSALTKVAADVARAVTLMDSLAKAKDTPDRLEIVPLQEAVTDATTRLVTVTTALGCPP